MSKIPWKYIGDWAGKGYVCAGCGGTLSVKYEMNDKKYCNKCIFEYIIASYEENEGGEQN